MAIRGRSFPLKAANIGRAPVAAGSGSATGTVAQTLPRVAQAAAGTNEPEYTGTIAQTLPRVQQTAIQASDRFVTAVSGNGRYFVDQIGDPILIHGDSPWSMMVDLSPSDMDTYLANRAALGTNVLLCGVVGSTGLGGPNNNGATYDGIVPFTGGDLNTPNSTYWSRMDSYLSKAEALGITLMVYPMDGWNTDSGAVFDGKSTTDCQTYGNWLATRWASRPNIIWAFGGDYQATTNTTPNTTDSQFNACLTGIRTAGDVRPATIQLYFYRSNSLDSPYWNPRIDFNFCYSYFVTYDVTLDAYAESWNTSLGKPATRPALFCEGAYDGNTNGGGAEIIRRQAGWALTSGSPGGFTGQEGVWQFDTGWESLLASDQSEQFAAVMDTVRGLPGWHLLVPDTGSALLTSGRGTQYNWTTDGSDYNNTNSYVTGAVTPDKSLAVIYDPSTTSGFTISASAVGPNPTLRRVDPSTGTSTGMTWTTTPADPGNNAAGQKDWLFIIEADSANSSGTIAQSLPHVTQAASGTAEAEFTGTISQTLPRVTQAAAGTAEAEFTGTVAQTLPRVAQAATGTAEAEYEGTIAQTLPHVTQAASGTNEPEYVGSAAQTLPRVGQAVAGTFTLPAGSGTITQTLPRVTQSITGTAEAEFTGVVIQTLPMVTQSGAGTFVSNTRTGSIVQTLGRVGQAAAGDITNPPGNVGIIGQTLGKVGQAAGGAFTAPGRVGVIAQVLPGVGQAVAGTVAAPVFTATIAQVLPAVTQRAVHIPDAVNVTWSTTGQPRTNPFTVRGPS